MYWRTETADAWTHFWELMRAELPDLPDLTPPDALPEDLTSHWLSPDLALSMTCGFPLRTRLWGRVSYVGTLDFGLGQPGHYMSTVIACAQTLPDRGLSIAFNARDSQSGWACIGADRHFATAIETGSHAASLAAVAERKADIAYIDAVTWRLLTRHDPLAAHVHVIGQTPPSPGLPLIAALDRDIARLRASLEAACHALDSDTADQLGGLAGVAFLDPDLYRAVPDLSPRGL